MKFIGAMVSRMIKTELIMVLGQLMIFCHREKIPCKITSIDRHIPVRKTRTHEEGRAVDISIKGWKEKKIDKLKKEFKNLNYLGAISRSDNKRRLIIDHDVGLGRHIHIQVRSKK